MQTNTNVQTASTYAFDATAAAAVTANSRCSIQKFDVLNRSKQKTDSKPQRGAFVAGKGPVEKIRSQRRFEAIGFVSSTSRYSSRLWTIESQRER